MLQLHASGQTAGRRTTSQTSPTTLRTLLAGVCLLASVGSAQAQASLDAMVKKEAQQAGFPAVVRASHLIDRETGVIEFAGDMVTGARVRFLQASHDDLIAGAEAAARQTVTAGVPDLVLCINCIARRVVLGPDAPREVSRVQGIFPSSVFTGFYSYGEIAPADGDSGCQFHNQTMTITTLVEPVTSRRLGHETRRNSTRTSWKNSRTFLSASIRVYVSPSMWQGRRDSNPHPPDLESGALAVRATPL